MCVICVLCADCVVLIPFVGYMRRHNEFMNALRNISKPVSMKYRRKKHCRDGIAKGSRGLTILKPFDQSKLPSDN